MTGGVEIVVDQSVGPRMQRQVARLAAFAGHFEMRHAFARVAEILHLELAQLLAAQRVEQQGGENGAIAGESHLEFGGDIGWVLRFG